MEPTGMHIAIPSRLGVGETFAVKVRALGPVRSIGCRGAWNTRKPALHGPFNRNVKRGIQYLDNCLPEWTGALSVEGEAGLEGPDSLTFDGIDQGVFPGDTRPIRTFEGFRWTAPGFHFLEVREPSTGATFLSNPVYVTAETPELRLYWGDPHWQTFFSDGIRCPEELYAFARDEGFLDFGALSDHVEGEEKGRHVLDALRAGFRFGFVGGGDIHDGRPGDCLAVHQPELEIYKALYPQGLTAAYAPALTRDAVYDAIRDRGTYATTNSRIYLDVSVGAKAGRLFANVRAASEDGIREVVLVRNGESAAATGPGADRRVVEARLDVGLLGAEDFCYARVRTDAGNMAWSSPVWGDEIGAEEPADEA